MTIEIKRSTPYKGNVTVTRHMVNPGGRDKTESLIVPEYVSHHSRSWLVQFNRGREFVMGKGRAPENARNGFWAGYGWQKGVMNPQVVAWDEPDIAAGMLAGNWLRFNDFSWYGRDNDEPRNDQAVHFTLHTRDSGPLELSNSEGIQAELMKVDPEFQNWHMENHNHWACGWVEKVILFPYKPGGYKLTSAWLKFCELQQRLNDYPILDEDAYYQMVQTETVDPAFDEITRRVNQLLYLEHDYTGDDLTVDQIWEAYGELNLEYEEVDNDNWLRHRTGYVMGKRSEHLYEEDVVRLISDWWAVRMGLVEPEADHE